jgi:anaerobic magnesium-protoporphyrin IX monomethyl ester cyclase
MRVMFVEPPKDFWFIMGEYIPPPFGLLCLAGYLEETDPEAEVEVVDSQAEGLDWAGLERRLAEYEPDVVAPSGMATANAYYAVRVAELAKRVAPQAATVLGGQHFTALAHETLAEYPFVDYVVRGEGEATLAELVGTLGSGGSPRGVAGLSYRGNGSVLHNRDRGLIRDLDSLPYPAYSHVAPHMKEYHFSLMGGEGKPFAIVEGSRGCRHDCSYCSQWGFWGRSHRAKSPERVVDEFERLYTEHGSRFFWFSDDNFGMGPRTEAICDGLVERGLGDEVEWFCQVRVDDIVEHPGVLAKMRRAGATWMLVGFDNPSPQILDSYRRSGVTEPRSRRAVELLRENGVFSQGTFIIGHRSDSHETVEAVRRYADELDPDIASFFALTPFPGTEVYDGAVRGGWIEDHNWASYDMVHAVMPTEHLTRVEVQQELYDCYESFFGSWPRRFRGMTSGNPITRRTYGYLAKQALLMGLKSLIG